MARKPRTNPAAPGAASAEAGHNSERPELTENEKRELFASHRTAWNGWKAKLAVVKAQEREMKEALKNDGFTVKEMQIADLLIEVHGEAKVKSEIEERLRVARWIGHPLGAQLDMFAQPDRMPAVERAYEEGKTCSIEGRTARPDYDPSTPQYRSFMAGYHDHQRELIGGMRAPRSSDESTLAHRE